MIPLDKCVVGGVYVVDARNFRLAVYAGEGKFLGVRSKFGSEFIDIEYHWDADDNYGTVKPEQFVRMCDMEYDSDLTGLKEYLFALKEALKL